jgi:hypothetical protein
LDKAVTTFLSSIPATLSRENIFLPKRVAIFLAFKENDEDVTRGIFFSLFSLDRRDIDDDDDKKSPLN